MSLVIDKSNKFSIEVSLDQLIAFDKMKWDNKQVSLVVERTAKRIGTGMCFLHGRVDTTDSSPDIEELRRRIEEQDAVIEKLTQAASEKQVPKPASKKKKMDSD